MMEQIEASSDVEKAEMLNKFYTSVFTRENLDTIPEFSDREFAASLNDVTIDAYIVRDKLLNLQPHKAAGPNNIFPRVLKEAAVVLSVPLTIIFTKSLSEGQILYQWTGN